MTDHIASTEQRAGSSDLTVDKEYLDNYEGAVPNHVAIIMDGNGRWATRRGMPRIRGHHAGADAVREIVESCRYLGVDVLTLYAFSSENWERPSDEVTGLMTLFEVYIQKERRRLIDNDVRLSVIGNRSQLADALVDSIEDLEQATAACDEMALQIAVSYGGREEILEACRQISEDVEQGDLGADEIDESTFERYLYTEKQPDPDLVIRTSGEKRLSNFLLWQVAYSEFYFTETLWPDFDEVALVESFESYDRRERRFGMTGRQVDSDCKSEA